MLGQVTRVFNWRIIHSTNTSSRFHDSEIKRGGEFFQNDLGANTFFN